MQKLLIATHNKGKLREFRHLLEDFHLEVTDLDAVGIEHDVEETGTTFAENAILKARAYAEMTGMLTWSDDSGLEVDALDGRPGVYSARYGGPGLTQPDGDALTDASAGPGDEGYAAVEWLHLALLFCERVSG